MPDKFSLFFEKNITTDKKVDGLKSHKPRVKSSKSNYDLFMRAKGHKKKFKPRDTVKRSNYERNVGRVKRRGGKTKSARAILSKKYGIKRAVEKNADKKYVLRHLEVQEMIRRLGYIYDNKRGVWDNREGAAPVKKGKMAKFKHAEPSEKEPEQKKDPKKDPSKAAVDTTDKVEADAEKETSPIIDVEKEEENDDESDSSDPEDNTKFTAIGNGGIEYDITEGDIKSYSARMMLAEFFGMKSALKFEEAEEEDEGTDDLGNKNVSVYIDPVISREKVVEKIESLGYNWNVDQQEWQKSGVSIFEVFKDKEDIEHKAIYDGRTYLAILGFIHAFSFDEEGGAEMEDADVLDNMSILGFSYNQETNKWDHFNG